MYKAEHAIYYKLAANSTITGIVGTNILPDRPETGLAPPYIFVSRQDSDRFQSFNTAPSSIERAYIQVDVRATSELQLKTLTDEVKTFDGFSGTVDGVTVLGMFLQGDGTSEEIKDYHAVMVFRVVA